MNGFTLTELLVVLAVLATLVVLAIPATAKLNTQTGVAQCSDNLRRFTGAMQILATESNGQLPQNFSTSWAWNLPNSVASQLLDQYGLSIKQLYCPANTPFDWDELVRYNPIIIGYATTLPGPLSLNFTNQNPTLIPAPVTIGPLRLSPPAASKRVLIADLTICASGGSPNQTNAASNNWTQIYVGPVNFPTSHMGNRTNLPAGGNLGMVDGHVEWRPFSNMLARTSGNGSPIFWW